jgi:hypothetical protein
VYRLRDFRHRKGVAPPYQSKNTADVVLLVDLDGNLRLAVSTHFDPFPDTADLDRALRIAEIDKLSIYSITIFSNN